MHKILLAASCALMMFAGCAGTASAQEAGSIEAYIKMLRKDVNADKVTIITQAMQFSPEEAASFWPIYTAYTKELEKLADEKLAGIKDYAANYEAMTNEKADQLALKALDLELRRNALKKNYYGKVKQLLGARKAGRFLQVESMLLMLIDLQVNTSLPIMQ